MTSSSPLEAYQTSYLSLSLSSGILRFDGPFVLKSGRSSPYFFNAGLFNDGRKISELASCYAQMIVKSGVQFDVLFGPAYKGIPLAATVAQALWTEHKLSVGFCYNRKEAKSHGEGGVLVGAPLKGRILILDDVMTAGTAIREAVGYIDAAGEDAKLAGVCIALDRQESVKEGDEEGTTKRVSRELGVPVLSVVTLDDIINYMVQKGGFEKEIQGMREYREKYGAKGTGAKA